MYGRRRLGLYQINSYFDVKFGRIFRNFAAERVANFRIRRADDRERIFRRPGRAFARFIPFRDGRRVYDVNVQTGGEIEDRALPSVEILRPFYYSSSRKRPVGNAFVFFVSII